MLLSACRSATRHLITRKPLTWSALDSASRACYSSLKPEVATTAPIGSTEAVAQVSPFQKLGYFARTRAITESIEALYRACAIAAERKPWFTRCHFGSDWKSKHLLRTTYVWLVHKRFQAEGKQYAAMEEEFFDEFWKDTTVHMRHVGVEELQISKNLKMVQEYSFELMILGYDIPLSPEYPTENEKIEAVAEGIGKFIYKGGRSEDAPPVPDSHLLHFAKHLNTELKTIYEIPSYKFLTGCIEFAEPPNFNRPEMIKGNHVDLVYNESPDGQYDVGEWRSYMDVGGKMFWWLPATRQATYEKPQSTTHQISDAAAIRVT